MEKALIASRDNAVLTLTLNRPKAHNAINRSLKTELIGELRLAHQDPDIRVVLIKAAGPGSFCSGVDLRDGDGAAFSDENGRNAIAEIIRAIRECQKIVVGQIEGMVIGGGVGLISALDLVYAADDLKFVLPEIKVGLFPLVATSLVRDQIPFRKLREASYLAVPLTSQEAAQFGLINGSLPRNDLAEHVNDVVQRLKMAAPNALAAGKRALIEMEAMNASQSLAYAEVMLSQISGGKEAAEGRAAFVEKRAPVWSISE